MTLSASVFQVLVKMEGHVKRMASHTNVHVLLASKGVTVKPRITVRSATSAKTVAYASTENIPSSASACQVFMEKTVEI